MALLRSSSKGSHSISMIASDRPRPESLAFLAGVAVRVLRAPFERPRNSSSVAHQSHAHCREGHREDVEKHCPMPITCSWYVCVCTCAHACMCVLLLLRMYACMRVCMRTRHDRQVQTQERPHTGSTMLVLALARPSWEVSMDIMQPVVP